MVRGTPAGPTTAGSAPSALPEGAPQPTLTELDARIRTKSGLGELNAIGGWPRLHPDVAPTYPGSLLAGVDKGLVVGLRRCDAAQLEVFRQTEAPEDPVDIRAFASEAWTVVTIGQFYDGLAEAISQLGEGIYTGDPGRQLRRWPTLGEIRPIERGADVRWAISTIKEQGEGASSYDPNDRDGELGHYYLFWEILRGREIIRTPNGWAFAGVEIPFPATYPVDDKPTVAGLPQNPNSRPWRDSSMPATPTCYGRSTAPSTVSPTGSTPPSH